MRTIFLAALVFAGSYAIAGDKSTTPDLNSGPQLAQFNTANIDTNADACTDFFKYADGKWIEAHPIPEDQSGWGVARLLQLWNETQLRDTLENSSHNNPGRTADEQKAGDFYYACMDDKTLNAESAAWLKPELSRIAKIKT